MVESVSNFSTDAVVITVLLVIVFVGTMMRNLRQAVKRGDFKHGKKARPSTRRKL